MKPSNYKSEEKHPFELMEAMSRQQKEFDLRKEEIVDKRVHLLEKMQRKNEKHDFLSKKWTFSYLLMILMQNFIHFPSTLSKIITYNSISQLTPPSPPSIPIYSHSHPSLPHL